MNTLEAIKTRRSIRKFLKKDVSTKYVEEIIRAGMYAPSSKNTQPWHFIVLKGNKKNEIVHIVEEEFTKKRKIYRKGGTKVKSSTLVSCTFTKEAPVLILVFNKAPYTGGEENVIKDCDYEPMDAWTVEVEGVSAAIQNMLLAIHDLGLGGVWLADFNFARKRICEFLNCDYDLIAGIVIGYAAYKVPPREISEIKLQILE